MKVTNYDSATSTDGTHTILHIIERLSSGGASRVALAISKHSTRQDNRFVHRIISLQRPTPEGLKLAEMEGYEVDHGCGKPFLDYQISKADIVHLHWWNSPTMLQFMQMELAASRMLVWCHVAGMHIPQVIMPELLDYADITVATNPTTFDEVPAFNRLDREEKKLKTAMIVDPADFDRVDGILPKEHEGFNVGYIGTVHHYKMHPHFVRMSSGIEVPDIRFLVCGSGIERELMLQARLLKSENRFSFLGHVEDIRSVIEQLDVYGYPLCEDTYASGELNLQEVMYAGIPPVVFPYGGIKGLVVNHYSGLVVETEKEYQAAIEYLYHHPEDRKRIGENAKQIARQLYGAENAALKLNPLYESILERPKSLHQWSPFQGARSLANHQQHSAASTYIESLGDLGRPYRTSYMSKDFRKALAADQIISQMTPLAHIGGILEHLNLHPQDSWLRFWSGLAFLGQGNGTLALSEFAKVKIEGNAHQRLIWHVANAAAASQQWDLVEQSLIELKQAQPDFAEAEKLWDQILNQGKKLVKKDSSSSSSPNEIIHQLESLLEQNESEAAQQFLSQVSPEDILGSTHTLQFLQHAKRLGLNEWVISLALEADDHSDPEHKIRSQAVDIALEIRDKQAFFQLIGNVLNVNPEEPFAHRSMAQWHIQEGEHLHAAQFLARSLQSEPDHIPTLKLLAQCFHAAGESESEKLTYEEINRIEQSGVGSSEKAAPEDQPRTPSPTTKDSNKEESCEPVVTALVSAYASEKFMEACLKNLVRQTLGDRLEILVIDSASTENEGEIVKRFQEQYSNIRYIRTDQRETLYEAWNRGVQEARGRYIVNANTDDAHRDDAFELLFDLLEKENQVGLAYADCVWTTKPNDQFPSSHTIREVRYPDYHPGLSLFYCYTACLQFWRKSTLNELGMFDTRWKAVGDYEILMRAAQRGVKVLHVPELLSLFYQNTDGITQQSDVSANEEQEVRSDFRTNLDISKLYQIDKSDSQLIALAWSDLAELAYEMRIPWHDNNVGDHAYAIQCLQQSLQLMPENELAAGNLLWLLAQHGHQDAGRKFLLQLSNYWNHQNLEALVAISTHWNAASEPQSSKSPEVNEELKGITLIPSELPSSQSQENPSIDNDPPDQIHWRAPFFNPSGYGSEAMQFVVPLSGQLPMRIHHNSTVVSEDFVAGLGIDEKSALQKMIPSEGEQSGLVSVCHGPAPCFERLPNFRHHVGRTMFETDRVPESWLPFISKMDQIWVPSNFNRESFIRSGVDDKKLSIVPGAVDENWFDPSRHEKLTMPSETGFRFLSVFEWILRKGWDVLLNAYLREFTASDDVVLTLRASLCNHPKQGSAEAIQSHIVQMAQKLGVDAESLPRIEILPDALPWQQLPSMYLSSQCLVAPSRGEGWGRPQHEAMMMGLPVIATNWSGTTEFMNDSNAYLLDYTLKEISAIDAGFEFYQGHQWAEPSVSHLRQLMRHVFENRKEARDKGEAAREHVRVHFGRQKVTRVLKDKLETLLHRKGSSATCAVSKEDQSASIDNSKTSGAHSLKVCWEGPFSGAGSLAHVNRCLTQPLIRSKQVELETVSNCELTNASPRANTNIHHSEEEVDVVVRHQWPPDFSRPALGKLVVVQPWEYGSLPREWVDHSHLVDEFWAYTEHVRAVYVESGIPESKVKTMPLGFDPSRFHPDVKPLSLPTQKSFKFLFVGGTLPRKGADLLLKSFCSLFGPNDDVCLVIKDFGGGHVYAGQTMEEQIKSLQNHPEAPEILYMNEEMDEESMPALYRASDCLLHPYRGEGFGLPVLEAMACGLAVIVTRGGACDDFTPDDCVYPVSAERQIIGETVGKIRVAKEAWWLEPSMEDLMHQMRSCYRDSEERRLKGKRASEYVHANWTWDKASQRIQQRLHDICRSNHSSEMISEKTPMGDQETTSEIVEEIKLPPCALLGDIRSAAQAYRSGQWQEAWMICIQAIKLRPFHPEAYLLLGKVAASTRHFSKAKQCAGILKKMTPDWEEARRFKKKLAKLTGRGKPKCKLGEVPSMVTEPRISVCMIARNEENQIGKCIESVSKIAHEVIVLDTGSDDATREVASSFGAKVVDSSWNDHFSEARNQSLEHATGDWLLILDADEQLSPDVIETLSKEVKSQSVMAYRLPILNHGTDEVGNSYVPRLVRNAPGLFFVGRVHEQIFSSMEVLRRKWNMDCRLGKTLIHHYGYTQEQVDGKNKNVRNLKLLERAIVEMPNEPNLLMNYGLELRRSEFSSQALDQYEKAFACMENMPEEDVVPEFREALVHQFAQLLVEEKKNDRLIEIATRPAVSDHIKTSSFHFFLGMAQAQQGLLDEALGSFNACIDAKDDAVLTPVMADVHSGVPYVFMAKIHAHRKDVHAANNCFGLALEKSPENVNIITDYARFLSQIDHSVEALQVLHRYIKSGASEMKFWMLGAEIALGESGLEEFALDWTTEAVKFFGSQPEILFTHLEALIVNRKWTQALNFKSEFLSEPGNVRQAALLVMTDIVAGREPSIAVKQNERPYSMAFVKLYRQLIELQDAGAIHQVNESFAILKKVLPSAHDLILKAVQSSEESCVIQRT